MIAASIFLALAGPQASAQATPLPTFTLAAALEYARQHSPTLAAAAAQVEQGRSASRVPRNRWLPRAGANAQLLAATDNNTSAVTFTSGAVPLPRIGGVTYTPNPNWSAFASSIAAIGGSQLIYDFGVTTSQIAAADAALAANQEDLATRALETTLAVTVAYRSVQAAHAVASAASAAVLRSRAHRDQAAALVSGQLRSRIFLERAEAQLSRFHIGELQAVAAITAARSTLAAAIGAEIPEVEVVEAPAALPPGGLPSQVAAINAAVGNDPRIKALRDRLAEQRETADAVMDLTHPTVSLTAALSGRAGGTPTSNGTQQYNGFVPNMPNWDVGVVANWSFLDPVTFAQARAAHAQEQVVADRIDAAIQSVRAGATSAWVAAQAALESLPEFQRAFDAAKANYEQADVRFAQGLGTSVEIADAEDLLTAAEIDLARGTFEFGRTQAELERAMAGGR